VFIPAGRDVPAAKCSGAGYGNRMRIRPNNGPHVGVDASDKATVIDVGARRADTDDVVGCGNAAAGSMTQGDVATSAAKERPKAVGRVDRYNSVLRFLVCSLHAIHGLTVPASSGKRSGTSATFATTA
jgi:hypothetical protein